MNPYSEDLRKKIIEALRRGATKSEAARSFGVSRSSVKRYAKLAEEGRSLAPKKRLSAALLARPQSDRAGVLEGQRAPEARRGAHPRVADRGDGPGAVCGVGEGCPGVLRALRLQRDGSTATTCTLGSPTPGLHMP